MLRSSVLFAVCALSSSFAFGQTSSYAFSRESDLEDFRPGSGRWSVTGGTLACNTKGVDDRIAWGRAPAGLHRVTFEVSTHGACGLRLSHSEHGLELRIDRGKGTATLLLDGAIQGTTWFESRRSTPLECVLELTLDGASFRIGDDEPRTVVLDAHGAWTRLELLSHRSAARFASLKIERAGLTEGALKDEELALRMARARDAVRDGDWREALELLTPWTSVDGIGPLSDRLPPELLPLFQQLAQRTPTARGQEPLRTLLEETTTTSTDGTIGLVRPFRAEWKLETPTVRRTETSLANWTCAAPSMSLTLVRFDGRLKYPFGADPATRLLQGSDASSMARASLEDVLAEHSGARVEQSAQSVSGGLAGTSAWSWGATWPTEEDDDGRHLRRDWWFVHRGNAHRLSVLGLDHDVAPCADDVAWILDSLTLHAPN